MKQYLKLFFACAFGLTVALSYATAQDNNDGTNPTNQDNTNTVTKAEATALKNQYAASNELNKKISALLADAPNMSQAQFEAQMTELLGHAGRLSDQMKRNPATEQQQQILARTIVAAQNTLDGLKDGTVSKDQALAAIRKLRGPLHQTLVGIASFLRQNGWGDILAAYLATLKTPDNTQISPEA